MQKLQLWSKVLPAKWLCLEFGLIRNQADCPISLVSVSLILPHKNWPAVTFLVIQQKITHLVFCTKVLKKLDNDRWWLTCDSKRCIS